MKELDVVFGRYLENHYPSASPTEIRQLDALLDMQDPLLFGMVLGLDPVPDEYLAIINKLRRAYG
jgi:antitoxin CptB